MPLGWPLSRGLDAFVRAMWVKCGVLWTSVIEGASNAVMADAHLNVKHRDFVGLEHRSVGAGRRHIPASNAMTR